MVNERNNEDIVWKHFSNDPLLAKNDKNRSSAKFEKQTSSSKLIQEILATASKNGSGNIGKPEGIITFTKPNNVIMFWEGKANIKDHSSSDYESNPIHKAVDGAIHYAKKALKQGKYATAIALGTSGETEEELKVTYFKLWVSDNVIYKEILRSPDGKIVDRLLSLDKTLSFCFPKTVEEKRKADNKTKDAIHGLMRKASLSEENKSFALLGSLLALKDDYFSNHYCDLDAVDLGEQALTTAERYIKKSSLVTNREKRERFMNPLKTLVTHQQLHSTDTKDTNEQNSYLKQILDVVVASNVLESLDPDAVGDFYTEFTKYTGGDGKGLGIVLTPHHITELFSEIANVTEDMIVIDTCFGTGSFLNSALHRGLSSLTYNENLSQTELQEKIGRIKADNIVGIELDPKMFTLGAGNLMLRGVNIDNLYEGSCFDPAIIKEITAKELPQAALINPPYALHKDGKQGEIEFIENATKFVAKGGYVVALVPVSTGTDTDAWAVEVKQRLLKSNTLWAVMSLPSDLFNGKAGTIVQILVFKVGVPQSEDHKTWFADWSDDGFVVKKHIGRDDFNGLWADRKIKWIESYKEREEKSGYSVLRHVEATDEWVTEAYLETDYSTLTLADYEKKIRDYSIFHLSNNLHLSSNSALNKGVKDDD